MFGSGSGVGDVNFGTDEEEVEGDRWEEVRDLLEDVRGEG